eukprot:3537031-Rhodomonas_salina.2
MAARKQAASINGHTVRRHKWRQTCGVIQSSLYCAFFAQSPTAWYQTRTRQYRTRRRRRAEA